jgi:hypothetical protein
VAEAGRLGFALPECSALRLGRFERLCGAFLADDFPELRRIGVVAEANDLERPAAESGIVSPGFQAEHGSFLNDGGSARPLRKRQSEQVQYVTSRKVETRVQSRSFEFSGVAFLGQMMARGTRPAGVSVQVLPSASEPLEPHTINTTISVPIAAMMPISAPYLRTSSFPDPRRGRDTTPEGTPILRSAFRTSPSARTPRLDRRVIAVLAKLLKRRRGTSWWIAGRNPGSGCRLRFQPLAQLVFGNPERASRRAQLQRGKPTAERFHGT